MAVTAESSQGLEGSAGGCLQQPSCFEGDKHPPACFPGSKRVVSSSANIVQHVQ